MAMKAPGESRFAVLFRTHFWDDFAERQYRRLVERSRGGEVFILVDETNGAVAIPHDNVVRYTENDLLALGLAKAGTGNFLWFNGDYSLYVFFERFPDFDHYIMVEYDVAANRDMGEMVARSVEKGYDFIGLTTVHPDIGWNFTDGCLDLYRLEDIQQRLICIALFSRAAIAHLFARRKEHSLAFERGEIRRWPFCEAYIPTELALGGFRMGELSEFGPLDHYEWRPSYVETDLGEMTGQAFVHPVLDPNRYIVHTMKHLWPPENYFIPGSKVRRRIRRVPSSVYWPVLSKALKERVTESWRKRVLRKPDAKALTRS